MIIKHYKEKVTNSVDQKELLDAYIQQGRSYRKTGKHKNAGKHFIKGSLTALIPLAASSVLNAQCQGPIGTNIAVGYGSANGIQIDLDDDSVTDAIIFSSASNMYIKAVNGASVGITNNAYMSTAKNLDTGVTITGGGAYKTGFAFLWFSFSGNNFNGTKPFHSGNPDGNIVIKKGSSLGWIRVNIDNNQSIDILDYGMDIDGGMTLAGDCASLGVLPVEMLYFRTLSEKQSVLLEWATASEQENAGFEVQRSRDGRNFHKISWISGQGTTNETINYTYEDKSPQVNIPYYYRLKQVDQDGTESFSPVQSAEIKDTDAIQVGAIFPNPVGQAQDLFHVKVNMPTIGDMKVQIFDLHGKIQNELNASFIHGESTISIPVRELSKGQYFVKLQTGDHIIYRELVIQ